MYTIRLWNFTYKTIEMPGYARLVNSTAWNLSETMTYESRCYSIYLTYFLLTVYVYLWFVFITLIFHKVDVCIFAKRTALLNYIHIHGNSIFFTMHLERISAFNVTLCCFSTNCIVLIKPLKTFSPVCPHDIAFKDAIAFTLLYSYKQTYNDNVSQSIYLHRRYMAEILP